jgi:hypothetical protein
VTASVCEGVFRVFGKPVTASPLEAAARVENGNRERPLGNQTEQLQGGETEHPEHQVAHHLGGSAYPDGPAAMVVSARH